MSDTWSDIQAVKSKTSSLRDKLEKRKRERQAIVANLEANSAKPESDHSLATPTDKSKDYSQELLAQKDQVKDVSHGSDPKVSKSVPLTPPNTLVADPELINQIEKHLQVILSDITLNLPVDSLALKNKVADLCTVDVPQSAVDNLLQKFSAQRLISCEVKEALGIKTVIVISSDNTKLTAFSENLSQNKQEPEKRHRSPVAADKDSVPPKRSKNTAQNKKDTESIESLLSTQSSKEKESKKLNEEITQLLSTPSAKEQSITEKFKSQGGAQVKGFCQFGTREDCRRALSKSTECEKLHFRKIIHKHTDESLGDCSFLNTCFHMETCKYVHYEIDYPKVTAKFSAPSSSDNSAKISSSDSSTTLFPPQWVQCDVRFLDMSVLGKFTVIMADPPWDIHMELPYGTMSDDEMRSLAVPTLQDDGYIFLWVTGRAMELGRECLKLWGYERIDEIIWVKTNQLQRIIRTGRTGHWFNHGKEHCLVGLKGSPKNINRGLDCDVIVAEVRATSHKPDEIYGIIERLAPGSRKLELFGRPHNVQPNWVTLGNQLDGVRLLEPEVVRAFRKKYPDGNALKPPTAKT